MNKKKYFFQLLLIPVAIAILLLILWNGSQKGYEQIPAQTGEISTSISSNIPQTQTPQILTGIKQNPLFVNPDNPRYFTDGTKINGKYQAIYLTGSHTWCNFQDCGDTNPPPAFDYSAYLDFLVANHHNFFRLWVEENVKGSETGDNYYFTPMPYLRPGPGVAWDGQPKFDLNQFDQTYFDRLRSRIISAGNRGIYVSVMLFDGWSIESKHPPTHNPWPGHPFNNQNNANGIDGDLNGDGQGEEVHTLTNTSITALQEAYVRKVIETVGDLNNVLYEISNESNGNSLAWQYHMIAYVKSYEATKPKQHPVGMTVTYPAGSNADLFASNADWISPNGDISAPPVADGSKVVLADTDHLCGICGNRQWVWKSFTRGNNLLFMDPYNGAATGKGAPTGYDPNNDNDVSLRLNLGYVRNYANRMNLVAMSPHGELCSTGYCLANPVTSGAEYLVFLPSGAAVANLLSQLDIDRNPSIGLPSDSRVDVDLSASPIDLLVEWFNPADGTIIDGGTVQGGASQSFTAPFSGDAVLYIYDANRP